MMPASPAFGGPGPLLLLVISLALDAVVGDLFPVARLLPGPGTVLARIAADLDRRLNRVDRGDVTLLVRGMVVVLALAGLAALSGWALARLGRILVPSGPLLEFMMLSACLSVRQPWNRVRAVRRALGQGGVAAARPVAASLGIRATDTLDDHGLARVALEGLARALYRKVVAPAFWYVLLGLPGALLWVAVDALSTVIGRDDPSHEQFGLMAARLDDALGFLPARLTGCLVAAAALFVPTANAYESAVTMWRQARDHRSLNAGWPKAALAGALGLALGGPYRRGEVLIQEAWIGRGRARAVGRDIDRALALHAVACLILLGLLGLLMAALATL